MPSNISTGLQTAPCRSRQASPHNSIVTTDGNSHHEYSVGVITANRTTSSNDLAMIATIATVVDAQAAVCDPKATDVWATTFEACSVH